MKKNSPYSLNRDPKPDLTDNEVDALKTIISTIYKDATFQVQRYSKGNELLVFFSKDNWKYMSKKDFMELKNAFEIVNDIFYPKAS